MAQDEMDAASRRRSAEQVYKNIRVLKGVPASDIIPMMRKIDDSLGVRCDFCHVIQNGPGGRHEGFEKDDKRMKGVARQMIQMTKDINRNRVVKNKVTCFTCHHGRAEPENSAPGGRFEPR